MWQPSHNETELHIRSQKSKVPTVDGINVCTPTPYHIWAGDSRHFEPRESTIYEWLRAA
jgi:hypothetical protein